MKKKSAIFTIVRDEPIFLPIWLYYYGKFFSSEDIYIIHHLTDNPENSFDQIWNATGPGSPRDCGYNVSHIIYEDTFDHEWLRNTVKRVQKGLLENYEVVVFAEVDEIIHYHYGLDKLINNLKDNVVTCRGFEVVHYFAQEPEIDLGKPLLQQRNYGYYAKLYNKTLISKIPLDWIWGFHNCPQEQTPNMDLHLIHLHKLDFNIAWNRNLSHKHTLLEKEKPITDETPGHQNLRQQQDWLKAWWMVSVDDCKPKFTPSPIKHIEIPKSIKNAI
jgi:hypothetical protein